MWVWVVVALALAAAARGECPRHCECKWRSGKESALCARAALSAVPPRLDPTTQLLDLTDNRLPVLRDDVFSNAGLLNLQRLYIAGCNLRTVRQHAFRALVNLVELDLSRNRIDSIPSHSFQPIRELRELRLGGNPIARIGDDSLSMLPKLVRVSLSGCKISEIEPRGFAGLEASLEYLELSKNKLQVLHVAVLASLRTLKGLELASNPWECTCALRPLRDWMIRKNVPATEVPDCALPPRLMTHSWDRLDLEEFACQPEVSALTSHYRGLEGDAVTLVCRVSGVPAPRVRWLRAGRLLANSTSHVNSGRAFMLRSEGQTSNLTIRSADIQDSGSYTCNAENRAGKAEAVLSLAVEKKPESKGFGGRALMAGMAVSAVLILTSCLIGLCAYETRKKRQLDRWNEQIVTASHRDESYEKMDANIKNIAEVPRVLSLESGRKRGDYRNVPLHDPEDDYEEYVLREEGGPAGTPRRAGWRRGELGSGGARSVPERDLHIPRFSDYNIRSDATSDSVQSSNSTSIMNPHAELPVESRGYNNNPRLCPSARGQDRLDNYLEGSDSDKNYPDLIEMSALGASSYMRSDKRDPYCFYTMPRRKDGDSRSPLLSSRRNSSGGDSATFLDNNLPDKSRPRATSRRSNSFLDLSAGSGRMRRNPSLPASPSRDQPAAAVAVPSATPLLDLSGLRDYSRSNASQPMEDYDFRASQLEKFLEEYRTLRDQLSRMKETRENLQRSRAVENEELRYILKGKPSIAVTETSSSAALADAASPLALSPPEYKPQQPRPEWLTTLLYRN